MGQPQKRRGSAALHIRKENKILHVLEAVAPRGDLSMSVAFLLTVAAECFALMLVGGGLYEALVVDPFWPKRPDLIQPERGGISRVRFWVPVHSLFELSVIFALVAAWPVPVVRSWLLMALISHTVARV